MAGIQVDLDRLNSAAHRSRQAARRLRSRAGGLRSAVAGVRWEGLARARFDRDCQQCEAELDRCAGSLDDLGSLLVTIAHRLAEADAGR